MGPSSFAGVTQDPFVLGAITLWMSQTNSSASTSRGIRAVPADLSVGGATPDGDGSLQGGADASWSRQWNRSASSGRTGAKEEIKLSFTRAYLFRTSVDYEVTGRLEKHAKLVPDSYASHNERVAGRTMLYLLAEPEALEQYAAGHVPVADEQLVDVLNRWYAGQVRLSGDTVAGVLARWAGQVPDPHGPRPLTAADQAAADALDELTVSRPELAALLARLHDNGALPVADRQIRADFGARFGLELRDPEGGLFPGTGLPEYLTRRDPGGRFLGHSGIHSVTFERGYGSVYDIVREQVDRTAPGLLAAQSDMWTGDGRRIGRVQGSVNALQAMLTDPSWEDLLSPNGQTVYLVNPIGWLLADIVRINLRATLDSEPEVFGFRPRAGLEVYGHGYVSTGTGTSRDTALGVSAGKFGGGGPNSSASGSLAVGEARHQGVSQAGTATTEQTVYSWKGLYLLRADHTVTVEVTRLDMAGRPLNNLLAGWYRNLDPTRSAPAVNSVRGRMELQVPRGLAEFRPSNGRKPAHDPRPLPALPGDAYITGALLDDGLPAALELMTRMFGPRADGARTRTNHGIHQVMNRQQIVGHLAEASAGRRYLLTDMLFVPGDPSRHAKLWLTGDLFDLEVVGPVEGTGAGRYTKHQSGTTSSSGTDHWRPTVSTGVSGSGTLHVPDPAQSAPGQSLPPSTGGGDTGASRTTGSGTADAGTENYRREQHIKQQGRVFLIVLHGRYRLEAELVEEGPLGAGSRTRLLRSDAFSGDVYAELYEPEVEELLARQAAQPLPRATEADAEAAGAKLARAPRYDLADVVVAVAGEPGITAERLHQSVARRIRSASWAAAAQAAGARSRTPFRPARPRTDGSFDAVVLTLDRARLADLPHRAVLRWAVDTLRADLDAARTAAPDHPAPEALERYRRMLDDGRVPRESGRPRDQFVADVVREVDEARRGLTGEGAAPARFPDAVPASVEAVDRLVQGIAHELDVPVRAEILEPDGSVSHLRPLPSGRVEHVRVVAVTEGGPVPFEVFEHIEGDSGAADPETAVVPTWAYEEAATPYLLASRPAADGGPAEFDETALASLLADGSALAGIGRDSSLVLLSGTAGEGDGELAQRMADLTGRRVWASSRPVGLDSGRDGTPRITYTDRPDAPGDGDDWAVREPRRPDERPRGSGPRHGDG
jgi:hypothetical protein